MKKIIVGWLFIFWSTVTFAQIETPEECILNTLKSGTIQKELAQFVTYNCVQKYIKQMESKAKPVNEYHIKNATLKYLPGFIATNNSSILPSFELQLKNDSDFTIIYAFIKIKNKKTNEENIYRLSVERPIKSFSVGQLRGPTVPKGDPATYWTEHDWSFTYIFGVD